MSQFHFVQGYVGLVFNVQWESFKAFLTRLKSS